MYFFILFSKTLYLIKKYFTIFYWQYLARKMVDRIWSILNEGYPGVKHFFIILK
jgi:hypothetical protein